jgi:hypothetical protein
MTACTGTPASYLIQTGSRATPWNMHQPWSGLISNLAAFSGTVSPRILFGLQGDAALWKKRHVWVMRHRTLRPQLSRAPAQACHRALRKAGVVRAAIGLCWAGGLHPHMSRELSIGRGVTFHFLCSAWRGQDVLGGRPLVLRDGLHKCTFLIVTHRDHGERSLARRALERLIGARVEPHSSL